MFAYSFALLERVKSELQLVRSDRKGVTALEYGVIAAAIIVAIATVVGTLGTNLSTTFNTVAGKL